MNTVGEWRTVNHTVSGTVGRQVIRFLLDSSTAYTANSQGEIPARTLSLIDITYTANSQGEIPARTEQIWNEWRGPKYCVVQQARLAKLKLRID